MMPQLQTRIQRTGKKDVYWVFTLALLVFGLAPFSCSFADTAEILPKGIWNTTFQGKFYLPTSRRFGADGNVEDAATDFNATLNSDVIAPLAAFEASPFNLPTGYANVGRSVVKFDYSAQYYEFSLQYGLTDRITLGLYLPYWMQRNTVSAKLDTSNATIGKNTYLNSLLPLAYQLPEGVPATVPLTTQDVQDLIGKGLDIDKDGTIDIEGYGFKPVKSWSDDGLSDIVAGVRYQYLRLKDWRFAFTGGVRFPTGTVDRTDNLVDLAFGTGAWGLLFQLQNDFVAVKNLVLNGTFRYEFILPDSRTLRIPEDVNRPLTPLEAEVDLDTGDVFEFEASSNYKFTDSLAFGLLYRYGFALKDSAVVDGAHVESLEDETDYTEHIFIASLSYSTIPLYQAKKFPIPIDFSISYRNRFAGSNNVLKSQYISIGLGVYF